MHLQDRIKEYKERYRELNQNQRTMEEQSLKSHRILTDMKTNQVRMKKQLKSKQPSKLDIFELNEDIPSID